MKLGTLAWRRIRHNRTTTLLTLVAIFLTTCMLMGLLTATIGMVRETRASLADGDGNYHVQMLGGTLEQKEMLRQHLEVEAFYSREALASVTLDRLRCTLMLEDEPLAGVNHQSISQGRAPQEKDEIAGPPSLFVRLGIEPALGERVTLSYRVYGEGEILTSDFVICGLYEERDLSFLHLPESRIAYSAFVSPAFADDITAGLERDTHSFFLRVREEDSLRLGEMEEAIRQVAADIGLAEAQLSLNMSYLVWMTDMDGEYALGAAGVSLLIVGFSVLVLYSIFYVSTITNVQELGRLRALGAGRKQIKGLLLREGWLMAAISLPFGLVAGYGAGRWGASYITASLQGMAEPQSAPSVSMFSWGAVGVVVLLVLATVFFSLLRPMQVAARISPMEAIRYQEASAGKRSLRKGKGQMTLTGLSMANLSSNRRRTLVTAATLGLGCILFMTVSGVLAGVQAENFARRSLPKGDFLLELDYSTNDLTYPENNLDWMQAEGVLGQEAVAQIEAIPGVARMERVYTILADLDHPGYGERPVITIAPITREEFHSLRKDRRYGDWSYDRLLEENGLVFGWYGNLDYYQLTMGETLSVTLGNGDSPVFLEMPLLAACADSRADYLIPIEAFEKYITQTDPTAGLYLWAEEGQYDTVKVALNAILEEELRYTLLCWDEELGIAQYINRMTLVIAYVFLLILGLISLINLMNTMITSVVTRRRELGLLQAIGLSDRQLVGMLTREGMIFTAGGLLLGLTIGNALGYVAFLWARSTGFMSIEQYQYPLAQTILMAAALLLIQLLISALMGRYVKGEPVIQRIRQ